MPLTSQYSTPLKIQAFYALLCILWNAIVMWQIHIGTQPIGPTGSVAVIATAVILVAALVFALRQGWQILYIVLSAIIFLLALSAVWSGLTNNPNLWPSVFWRITGIIINIIGMVSFICVLIPFIRQRNTD